jgi:hypothetical protein
MPRGGSRVGSGRAPDPSSLREAARLEGGLVRTLPRERSGAAPAWPLAKASARERVVWREEWKRPQAIVWDEQRLHRQVAMYVRTLVEAEEVGVAATRRTLLLQQENALLITTSALLKAGFRISTNAVPTAAAKAATSAGPRRSAVPSSRGRLRAVEDVGPGS